MQQLIDEGKIRYVGLSEVDEDVLKLAHRVLGDKLVAVQKEFSIANHANNQLTLFLLSF